MNENEKPINLICFPFAGGSKYSFSKYKSVAPENINVITFELPGRGERILEPLLTEIDLMVDDFFFQLERILNKPYILYGHSMGTLLAYLVIKKLVVNDLQLPEYLIVTGCEGPSIIERKTKLRSTLDEDDFIKELKILGGIPDEIFQDKSFLDFFAPILRADLKGIESYVHLSSMKMNVPICIVYGSDENLTFDEVQSWQLESKIDVEIIQLPGDHFFIFKHPKKIMDIIVNKLN